MDDFDDFNSMADTSEHTCPLEGKAVVEDFGKVGSASASILSVLCSVPKRRATNRNQCRRRQPAQSATRLHPMFGGSDTIGKISSFCRVMSSVR